MVKVCMHITMLCCKSLPTVFMAECLLVFDYFFFNVVMCFDLIIPVFINSSLLVVV